MDFLREYFCTIMVTLVVFQKGVVLFYFFLRIKMIQRGMDGMIGVKNESTANGANFNVKKKDFGNRHSFGHSEHDCALFCL